MYARPLVRSWSLVVALGFACGGCASATTRAVGSTVALVGAGTACVGTAMVTEGAICGPDDDPDDDGIEEPSIFEGADPEAGAAVMAVGFATALVGGLIYAIGATDPPTGIASSRNAPLAAAWSAPRTPGLARVPFARAGQGQ